MAQKGHFKSPVEPLEKAFERAMKAIDCHIDESVAVFMIAGEVMCTPSTSKAFENNARVLAGNMVGIYDAGADHRCVKEDLAEFYK